MVDRTDSHERAPDGGDGAKSCAGPELDEHQSALVAIAQRQDRDAFRLLFDHFAPRVKSYLARQGTSDVQAEELAQDVMLKVWQKAQLYDPAKAAVSTWIFRIARNRRIDVFRQDKRPELDPEDPALQAAPEPMAEDVMDQRQVAERVKGALGTLPKEQRTVLELAFYQDLSHTAISRQLDIPLGTVKSRMRLAFQKLSERMKELDG